MSTHDVAAFFASLSQDLLAERDEDPTLERIAERALEVVQSADACALTLRRRRGRLETVASTSPVASQADQLQYELGEGPCTDTATHDEPYLVVDTADDPRWPAWGPRAAALGMRSLISVQLSGSALGEPRGPLGAMNLYASRPGAFEGDDLDLALIYATHAANALTSARLVTGLEVAMHSRHLIGVAQGILMQRYDLTLEQSFRALQRYSSNANIKVRDLALLVLQERTLPADYERPDPAR